jgi:peptide alpha-N-acetyltransferase
MDSSFLFRLCILAVFTYRYFLHRFPELCIFAVTVDSNEPIGCVVGKIDEEDEMFPDFVDTTTTTGGLPKEKLDHFQSHNPHKLTAGYIGMLAVSKDYRRRGIGKALVQRILRRMKAMGCCSATLETEVSNTTAQLLYEDCFGFIREELLVRYYLNWSDAYRLRLWF